jgi:hypothetical protein
MKGQGQSNETLTRKELAMRWQVSVGTVKRREKSRLIRPLRLKGRIIRFRLSDVLQVEQESLNYKYI